MCVPYVRNKRYVDLSRATPGRTAACPRSARARARIKVVEFVAEEREALLLLVAGSAAALLAPVSADVLLAFFPAMATGVGASSSQLRDTSPTRQRTYPMPMSVQHMRVSNKATALRELHRSQRMHMEKLRNMKPGIDMKRPEQPKFLQYNAKRVQMEKERNLTIERENKILLGKMYSIMNSEPAYKTTQHKTISLNMSIRKQEYDRIARENAKMAARIAGPSRPPRPEPQRALPTYDYDIIYVAQWLCTIFRAPCTLSAFLPRLIKQFPLSPV